MTAAADDAPVPGRVLDAAIAWQLRLDAGGAADRAALQAWLDAHPDHARVWRQLGRLDAELAAGAAGPATRATLQRPVRAGRRRAGALLGLVLAACAGLAVLDRFQPAAQLLADLRTGTGERRAVTLPDGSRLHMDTRTALDLAFDGTRRAVVLRAGRIAVETAHGAGDPRPFVVLTPTGSLRALGTRFMVEAQGGTRLTVTEAAVAARPAACAPAPQQPCAAERTVRAGETVRVHADRVDDAQPAAPEADAWKDGMLVVEDRPLAEVVARLARYRPGRLAVDPRVADLRVTGTLPLADTDQALLALTAAVPVELHEATRWWVTLRPRTD
ncbi:MAG: FecR domain-containing protein [Pseudorhodoferax sp.]